MSKISDLISDIRIQNLVLPEFQREYVWTQEQAKQLIVSLFRGYPTGSLLFWITTNPPELKNLEIPQGKLGATSVILDGQQRLTTLYLFIENNIPPYYKPEDIKINPRDLYFDLDSGEFQYYQVIRMKNNPTWVRVTDCLASPITVKVFEIVQQKVATEKATAEQFQLAQLYTDNLTRLHNILERDYPVQIVPPQADIDEAIDVFDRVNSLGTKLTDAELALTHITGKWAQARQEMKKKITSLENKGFVFDLKFMVRCLVGVVHGRALFEIIHRTDAERILNGWKELTQILDYLVTILPGRAYIHSTDDLNTTNVLVPVVVYLARHGGKFPDNKELNRFIHWVYAANMWGRYSSQTDQKLDHDISIIQRDGSPWNELVNAIIEQRGRIKVESSDLEGRGIQNPLYRMMFIIAKTRNAMDWFNGSPLSSFRNVNNRYIFPNTLLYKSGEYNPENHLHKKLVTEIANRFFSINGSGAVSEDVAPSNYLEQAEQKYPGSLAKQFVPRESHLWLAENLEGFLVARRKLIANAINDYMDHLITEPAEPKPTTLEELIAAGESASLEFKSSLYFDKQPKTLELQKKIFKTLAGFLNVEGGILLIGVEDNGNVIGIEHCMDHKPQKMSAKDKDTFGLLFRNTLINYLSTEFHPYIHLSWAEHQDHTVAIIKVDLGPKPAYLTDKKQQNTEFYIRAGNQTKLLDVEEAINYIDMHWEL